MRHVNINYECLFILYYESGLRRWPINGWVCGKYGGQCATMAVYLRLPARDDIGCK